MAKLVTLKDPVTEETIYPAVTSNNMFDENGEPFSPARHNHTHSTEYANIHHTHPVEEGGIDAGTIILTAKQSIPGYLECDGSAKDGIQYPRLAGIIGSTTLPDYNNPICTYTKYGTVLLTQNEYVFEYAKINNITYIIKRNIYNELDETFYDMTQITTDEDFEQINKLFYAGGYYLISVQIDYETSSLSANKYYYYLTTDFVTLTQCKLSAGTALQSIGIDTIWYNSNTNTIIFAGGDGASSSSYNYYYIGDIKIDTAIFRKNSYYYRTDESADTPNGYYDPGTNKLIFFIRKGSSKTQYTYCTVYTSLDDDTTALSSSNGLANSKVYNNYIIGFNRLNKSSSTQKLQILYIPDLLNDSYIPKLDITIGTNCGDIILDKDTGIAYIFDSTDNANKNIRCIMVDINTCSVIYDKTISTDIYDLYGSGAKIYSYDMHQIGLTNIVRISGSANSIYNLISSFTLPNISLSGSTGYKILIKT